MRTRMRARRAGCSGRKQSIPGRDTTLQTHERHTPAPHRRAHPRTHRRDTTLQTHEGHTPAPHRKAHPRTPYLLETLPKTTAHIGCGAHGGAVTNS